MIDRANGSVHSADVYEKGRLKAAANARHSIGTEDLVTLGFSLGQGAATWAQAGFCRFVL